MCKVSFTEIEGLRRASPWNPSLFLDNSFCKLFQTSWKIYFAFNTTMSTWLSKAQQTLLWRRYALLGNTSQKKNVFFRALPERGGGGPCPNFLAPSTMLSLIFWHQYHVMWYFLVIFNTKIIKSTKIMITIITPIIVVIIVTWFCNMC